MTAVAEATAGTSVRHVIEQYLAEAVESSGSGSAEGALAAEALGVAFAGPFAAKWADAMTWRDRWERLFSGAAHWSEVYGRSELRGHGDDHECAADMALCDLTWAVDDLMALGGER